MNFLKAIASILLLFAFATQTFGQGLIVLNYYLNTESFAKNCENKARPKMHCEGKCQMKKEFKKDDQKNDQNSERKLVNKTEVMSSRSFFASLCVEDEVTVHSLSSVLKSGFSRKIPHDIFHPPTLVA